MTEHSDFQSLYDDHPAYIERRNVDSHAALDIQLEANEFKVPNLVRMLPDSEHYHSIIEIGSATGEVLAAFPDQCQLDHEPVHKLGFDISPQNVAAARERYAHIEFSDSDFARYDGQADIVVLSDVLEHVPDDVDFLRKASRLAKIILINLPLEDNWINRKRNYGIDDESGHLRAYSLSDGMSLIESAGLRVVNWHRVWPHETAYDVKRRRLRRQFLGHSYSGGPLMRIGKTLVYNAAGMVRPFGRRLFPSNLFACAVKQQ